MTTGRRPSTSCLRAHRTAFAYFKSHPVAQPLHSGHLDHYDEDGFIA